MCQVRPSSLELRPSVDGSCFVLTVKCYCMLSVADTNVRICDLGAPKLTISDYAKLFVVAAADICKQQHAFKCTQNR
eukprot:6211124-Pleurochrysis_carterae.AAC.1